MLRTRSLIWVLFPAIVLSIGCEKRYLPERASKASSSNSIVTPSNTTAVVSNYTEKSSTNLRILLTDAPSAELDSVFLNISQVELILEGKGREARLVLGQELGVVDIMTLRNGLLLPISDVKIPKSVMIKQVRIVISGGGNSILKTNAESCDLRTPNDQRSAVKVVLKQPIYFEEGYTYSLVMDFDAEKSVTIFESGGCVLKPVLKVSKASRVALLTDRHLGEESLVDGLDQNQEDWDLTDVNQLPPLVGEIELPDIFY